MLNLNNIDIYPCANDPFGNDIIEAHAHHFKADIVISLMDAWVLRHYGQKKMRWCVYMPIDHDPIPPAVLEAIKGAYRVCSYSRWGERMLNDAGVINTYIPHGVDTKMFAPADKIEARKKMGIDPDCFLIGMVAANKGTPSRKAFPENLAAVAMFKRAHPELKVKLYLHTGETTMHQGIDFDVLLKSLDYKHDEVIFINQYKYLLGLSEEYMANAYNAMDVLLASTMAEGFGIPIVEAQACGTPVITTNFSSMPELTWAGYCVMTYQKHWTALNSWIAMPSIPDIALGLEWALEHANDTELQARARAGALAYDWDVVVADYWKPFLEGIEAQIASDGEMMERIT